jgi:hypothetical protein
MARPKKHISNLDSTYESVLFELNILLKELQDFRSKALVDYKEVKFNTEDNADRIQLEQIRSNAMKSFENYFKLRLEVSKIHALVASKLSIKDNSKIAETLNDTEKDGLDKYLEELKTEMRNNRNGKK